MRSLPAQTLRGLLRSYETAIAELRAMRDPAVEPFIDRVIVRRDEVTAALALQSLRAEPPVHGVE
jgi:hypothetical protein